MNCASYTILKDKISEQKGPLTTCPLSHSRQSDPHSQTQALTLPSPRVSVLLSWAPRACGQLGCCGSMMTGRTHLLLPGCRSIRLPSGQRTAGHGEQGPVGQTSGDSRWEQAASHLRERNTPSVNTPEDKETSALQKEVITDASRALQPEATRQEPDCLPCCVSLDTSLSFSGPQ